MCGLAAQPARARVRRRRLTRRLGASDACAARLVQGNGLVESTTTILYRLCAAVAGVQVLLLADVQVSPRFCRRLPPRAHPPLPRSQHLTILSIPSTPSTLSIPSIPSIPSTPPHSAPDSDPREPEGLETGQVG